MALSVNTIAILDWLSDLDSSDINSVVVKDIPSNSIAVSNPCKVIREVEAIDELPLQKYN
jgi:hypothetical protein